MRTCSMCTAEPTWTLRPAATQLEFDAVLTCNVHLANVAFELMPARERGALTLARHHEDMAQWADPG